LEDRLQIFVGSLMGVLTNRLDEGEVGRHALAVVGTTAEHEPLVLSGEAGKFLEEPRFANARLASNEHGAALAVGGQLETVLHRQKLWFAANERAARPAPEHGSGGSHGGVPRLALLLESE
jgi:hypothetical protein